MNLLYFDCGMGAAGDMLTAALLELCPEPEKALEALNGLGIPGVRYVAEKTQKCGITGTNIHVYVGECEEGTCAHSHDHDHPHFHGGMEQIRHWVAHMQASEPVRRKILTVYDTIARAESHVHGISMEHIHFHEVGTLDALADVAAVCYLMERLGNPEVYASPVHVGSGHVSCAHGILPVPAPATAEILKGVPIYGGQIQGELCTPTGAALLKAFVKEFGDMPVMTPTALGYGMGKKNFAMANCVRAVLGSAAEEDAHIVELCCNLDDMTGEDIGFAMERLLAAGAVDVFTTPICMKKNRPAVLLTVLCHTEQREELVRAIFHHTTTLGIREQSLRRYTLERRTEVVHTPYGPVRRKISQGYGTFRSKPEFDDLAEIARAQGLPLSSLRRSVAEDDQ